MAEREKDGKKGKGAFIKGAATIAAGGFIAKLIGAFYRIPLTNLIGGRGIGLYQLVYPVYCLLLTVSATGIPSSIAKLTAERIGKRRSSAPVFRSAMKLFLLIGLVGSAIMALVAPFLSKAQGSESVTNGYYALAPSVFLVSAISVFRGWFQGKNRMFPTALSEIVEQLVKVGFGLFFAYLYRDNIEKAVVFLLLSVSLSELVALLLMLALYRRAKNRDREEKDGGRVAMKHILRLSIPVTLSSMLLPLSSLLDSVLVVRLLEGYAADAVTLYGLFSGGAVTVINLPVSVCYGIAAASIPAVATAVAEGKGGVRKRLFFSLGITIAVAAPSALALYFFAEPAAKIIFRSLAGEELTVLVRLIKTLSVSALLLSMVQTLSACLTAQGKPKLAAFSMLVAVVVKTAAYALLLRDPKISVFGVAHATNLCYLVAFLLDLLYNLIVSKKRTAQANGG
ncbi:MAG: polysaccharide biosynthesis protein [Clostridia bacterium]|nr:polysaccharide biosynthesis protein [Clostridia bacterium]